MVDPAMSDLPFQSAGLGRALTVSTPDGPREVDIYTEEGFKAVAELFTRAGWNNRISYEATWLGVPIIQTPEDVVTMQELLWRVRPDVVVECGLAHGGGLLLYASILEMTGKGRVVGVDVEIRKYNRLAIESHPMSRRIALVEGSSVADDTIARVRELIRAGDTVLVVLDSNHSRDHVRMELERYAPLVTPESYIVVFDTVMPLVADSPRAGPNWSEDNPLEAVRDFLASHNDFEVDTSHHRLGVTHAHGGVLRRVGDPRTT